MTSFATTKLVVEALSYTPAFPQPRAQALAAVLGALLGDALGVPHEFKPASVIPPAAGITMVMPENYPKSYNAIPYGTWSDDGSQLLCLLDVLTSHEGNLHLDELAEKLLGWYSSALHQAGGVVFDCGGQTGYAIRRLKAGVPAAYAAMDDYSGTAERLSNGNGSLMRALPAALSAILWEIPDAQAVRTGIDQSRVTHAHPLALMTCAVYTQLAIQVARGAAKLSWRDQAKAAAEKVGSLPGLLTEEYLALEEILRFGAHELPTGHGFAPNTFWSAVYALDRSTDYPSAVREAIAVGNDTDTTATVAGGLAALAYGLAGVPSDWIDTLIVPEESEALLNRLPL